jgi:hypothetical protein
MKFGVQCLIGKAHLSVSVKKQTEHLIVCMHNHCRQRASIENVSSTSGILYSGILKEDTDDYRQFL